MTVYKNFYHHQNFDESSDDSEEDNLSMTSDDSSTSETEDSEDESSEEENLNRPAIEDDEEMIVSSTQPTPPPEQFSMDENLESCLFEENNEEYLIKALDSIMLHQSRVFHNIIHEVGKVLSQIQPGRWDSDITYIHDQFMEIESDVHRRI